MSDIKNKQERRFMRHARVRKRISGTATRPRLVVFKSAKHVYAQLIDDDAQKSILGASTLSSEIKSTVSSITKTAAATEVGKLVAKKLKEKNIEQVVFDRSGYPYHGVIKHLAEAVRAEGFLA